MGEKSHRVGTENKGTLFGKKDNQGAPKGYRVRGWVAIIFSFKYF